MKNSYRVLSGQGKPEKTGKMVIFSKIQGQPRKIKENRRKECKVGKSGKIF